MRFRLLKCSRLRSSDPAGVVVAVVVVVVVVIVVVVVVVAATPQGYSIS